MRGRNERSAYVKGQDLLIGWELAASQKLGLETSAELEPCKPDGSVPDSIRFQ